MCHLRSMDQWISAENMAMKIGIHSVRTVEKLLGSLLFVTYSIIQV